MLIARFAVLFGLVALAPAQTFVVDSANGPGTDYMSIAQAVAAVPDGAVLRVRAGSYSSFSIYGKSLKVLADPGARVFSPVVGNYTIAVSGLPAGKTVLLQGLDLRSGYPGTWPEVVLSGNQGTVLLDRMYQASSIHAQLTINNCAGVQVSRHVLGGFLLCELQNSHVTFDQTTIRISFGTPLVVNGGSVELVDCTVQAGILSSLPVILLQNAHARLVGATVLDMMFIPSIACVSGTGTVDYDPQVTFLGNVPFAPTVVATQQEIPLLRTSVTATQVNATLSGPDGALAVIAVGINSSPLLIPGLDGALWLDPSTMFLPAFGVFASGQPITATLPLAPGPVPAVRAVWHGAVLDPSGQLLLSNPSLTILP